MEEIHQSQKIFLIPESPHHMSRILRKLDFCLCENKGADQLCRNCTADHRLSYTPGIYADGYIVFAFPFVRSSVRMFVGSFVG